MPTTSKLDRLSQQVDEQRAELDRQVAVAQEVERERARLQRNLDDAADALQLADSRFGFFKARAAELQDTLATLWGRSDSGLGNGTTPDYSGLVACRAAVVDFQRVRPIYQAQVNTAQAALDKFEREHLQNSGH